MNLSKKKKLASRLLGVGVDRIKLNQERLEEIKEAITNQDIRDLVKNKAIIIKEIKGRRKKEKRKHRKGPGKIKKKIRNRKRDYLEITRKLRKYLKSLKRNRKINKEKYEKMKIQIKSKTFKTKAHMNESLGVKT